MILQIADPIPDSDPVLVLIALAAIVWAAVELERRFAAARALGAAMIGILGAMLISNIGLLPAQSQAYSWLQDWGIPLGVALILMSVDLRSVMRAGPKMLIAFGIGAVGTAVGATVAGIGLADTIGPEHWKLAGQYTGTYTGGGMNFSALRGEFDTSSDLFTTAMTADILITAFWMLACLTLPLVLGKSATRAPAPHTSAISLELKKPSLVQSLYGTSGPVRLTELTAVATLALGAVWLASWLHDEVEWLEGIPQVLWLTTIVLILAQIPMVKKLSCPAMFGNYLLFLFLAGNGAQSVIWEIIQQGPGVFYFAAGTVAVHGLVIFGVGTLCRIDAATLAVASQANVGGPASAIALASARGYADRLLPGVAVGLLGYAVGNFSGIAVANLVRSITAG